jgi:glycosyltransferase involved in cell wall biosynthesis
MKPPLISVLMAVHNGERFLAEAVQSILDQTLPDFEFLIVDDGSTDRTPFLLDDFARRDSRVRVLPQANQGLTQSLNTLLGEARSEFIARMDADDVSHPERFAAQVDYLRRHPACAAVGTGAVVVDATGQPLRGELPPDDPAALREMIRSGQCNPLRHGSAMLRASMLGWLRPVYRFRYSQDFDLWVRLLERHELGMVPRVLYQTREHGGGIHARSALAGPRQEQRRLVLQLRREGMLFNNEVCQRRVAQLYETQSPPCASPMFDAARSRLNALFVAGEFSALRRECLAALCHGQLRRRASLLLVGTLLPVKLAHRLADWTVSLSNRRSPVKVLTLTQVKRAWQTG